jgi:hypothetical protein
MNLISKERNITDFMGILVEVDHHHRHRHCIKFRKEYPMFHSHLMRRIMFVVYDDHRHLHLEDSIG